MRIPISSWPAREAETSTNSKLMKLFVDQLQDIYWAEHKLVRTLPKLEKAATSASLKRLFNGHLALTIKHVSRVEKVFECIGEEIFGKKCFAISGIIDEAQDIIDETDEGTSQRDAGLVFAGQKIEHYEIATYGSLLSVARTLGFNDAADLIGQTLVEEKDTDALLIHIAEEDINYQASKEMSYLAY
jgi:ferritin-like metal-binding protein YciE